MNLPEIIFGTFLVILLLGLAGYFAWRQKQVLTSTRQGSLSPDDRQYVLKQVRRRLLCSVLMVASAGMLIGWFFLEGHIRADVTAVAQADDPAQAEADRRASASLFTIYWIAFLLVWLVIVCLAAADFLATARFGLRQQRQLEAERRAVLDAQASRLRKERNGHQ